MPFPDPAARRCGTAIRRARRVVVAAALTLAPAAALAQDPTLHFNGSATGVHAFGYYVGPYSATLQRPGMSIATTVYCVDFLNSVSVGSVASINLTSLAGGSLRRTRHPGDLTEYRRAAWLTDQFAVNAHGRWGGIQAAIWNIFAPGTPQDGKPASNAAGEAYWTNRANLFMASEAALSYDWGRFHVVTDTRAAGLASGVGIQEFITAADVSTFSPDVAAPNVVPEPETWALMAIGLTAVGAIAWQRRRRV